MLNKSRKRLEQRDNFHIHSDFNCCVNSSLKVIAKISWKNLIQTHFPTSPDQQNKTIAAGENRFCIKKTTGCNSYCFKKLFFPKQNNFKWIFKFINHELSGRSFFFRQQCVHLFNFISIIRFDIL